MLLSFIADSGHTILKRDYRYDVFRSNVDINGIMQRRVIHPKIESKKARANNDVVGGGDKDLKGSFLTQKVDLSDFLGHFGGDGGHGRVKKDNLLDLLDTCDPDPQPQMSQMSQTDSEKMSQNNDDLFGLGGCGGEMSQTDPKSPFISPRNPPTPTQMDHLRAISAQCKQYLRLVDDFTNPPNVFVEEGLIFTWTRHNDVYCVSVNVYDVNVAAHITFLHKLVALISSVIGGFDEETLKNNFSAAYELLDEVIDNGVLQATDTNMLTQFLSTNKLKGTVSSALNDTALAWRPAGIVHKKNEIYVDVIEKINTTLGRNNEVLSCDIVGNIKLRCFLSGMPELLLVLNDKRSKPQSDLDLTDVRFHQCVRSQSYHADNVISFVPPDGEFDLMSYHVKWGHEITEKMGLNATERGMSGLSTLSAPGIGMGMTTQSPNGAKKLPVWCEVFMTNTAPDSPVIEFSIKLTTTYAPRTMATLVNVTIPVPQTSSDANFRCTSGTCKLKPETNSAVWTLRSVPGRKEYMLTARIHKARSEDMWFKHPVKVDFNIPFFTFTGINVDQLKIFETSGYHALPWVRYITQAGSYTFNIVP